MIISVEHFHRITSQLTCLNDQRNMLLFWKQQNILTLLIAEKEAFVLYETNQPNLSKITSYNGDVMIQAKAYEK